MKVIDVCSFVPDADSVRQLIAEWIDIPGYVRVFGPTLRALFGLEEAAFAALRRELTGAALADRLVERVAPALTDATGFLQVLDAAGVEVACLFRLDERTTTGVAPLPPEQVARYWHEHPDRYLGFIGVDPHAGQAAVETLDHAVETLGYRGVVCVPFRAGIYANDPLWRPIYERCIAHDVPVWIHTANNWSAGHAMDFGRPLYIDKVAVRYPELKIIAGHGGWPWVQEMVVVAWRHENVYIDPSAHQYRYFTRPGSGWEPLLHFGNTTIKDKVVFGSDWPLLGATLPDVVQAARDLPLKPDVMRRWLYDNAARVLRIGDAAVVR